MDLVFFSQWAGAFLIVAFYPFQYWRLFLTKNPVGLSFLSYCFLAVGSAGYLSLGIHRSIGGIIFSNIFNLIFSYVILRIIWKRSPVLSHPERVGGLLLIIFGFGMLGLFNLFAPHEISQAVSGIVGVIGIFAFAPVQALDLHRKKDAEGISLLAFIISAIGLFFYTLLGFLVKDLTILLGNGFDLLATVTVVAMVLKYRKNGC